MTYRNGPRAARSGQRAEPAVTELDRLAMKHPEEARQIAREFGVQTGGEWNVYLKEL